MNGADVCADPPTTLLIGGTSHTGKSTVAGLLAGADGVLSTDTFARHPGRPWAVSDPARRPVVARYYREHDVPFLLADVKRHYRETIAPLLAERLAADRPAVVEGSAVLPGSAYPPGCVAVWLLIGPDELGERMRRSSGHAERPASERELIDRFLARAVAFDADLRSAVFADGLPHVELRRGQTPADVADELRRLATKP